jgi:hypothetical protein
VRRYDGVPPYRETIGYVVVGKRLMRQIDSVKAIAAAG